MAKKKKSASSNNDTKKTESLQQDKQAAAAVAANQSSKSNTLRKRKKTVVLEPRRSNGLSAFLLSPIAFVVIVIPLLIKVITYDPLLERYDWFPPVTDYADIFLYVKQQALVVVGVLLFIILLFYLWYERKRVKLPWILLPLGIFALLCLLSALFSEDRDIAFRGSFDQFESVLALLAYALLVFYTVVVIQTEREIQWFMICLSIGALIMGTLGMFQAFGLDFIRTDFAKNLFFDGKDASFNVADIKTYMTLFNPNYVGVYVGLLAPIFLVRLIFARKLPQFLFSLLLVVELLISLYGSGSKAGILAIGAALLFLFPFLFRQIIKRWYLVIPAFTLLICTFLTMNNLRDNAYTNSIRNALKLTESEPALTELTHENGIRLTYQKNKMVIYYYGTATEAGYFLIQDENGNELAYEVDYDNCIYTLTDPRFTGISAYCENKEGVGIIPIVKVGNTVWKFLPSDINAQSFQYIREYYNGGVVVAEVLSKIETPETAIFTKYPSFFSGRGFIWARTIPLLKDHIFLGCGADTFAVVYPHTDYVGRRNAGYFDQIMTKPHSLYLQIAVQDGVLALLAFLALYLMYFLSSIKLYCRGKLTTSLSQTGLAIFIGTVAYMIMGISNDSSITTAPLFWAVLGIGITVNLMVTRRKRLEAEALEQA